MLAVPACVLLSGAASECTLPWSSNASAATSLQRRGDVAQQVMYGVRHNITTHEGEVIAALRADSAHAYDDATRYDLFKVSVVFLDTAGTVISTMTGEAGLYLVHEGHFEARGNVVVQREDGRQLHTSYATIDRARRLVVSDSSYRYVDGSAQREGSGFELDPATLVPQPRTSPADTTPAAPSRR